jgi:hypothetical protein
VYVLLEKKEPIELSATDFELFLESSTASNCVPSSLDSEARLSVVYFRFEIENTT